MGYRAARHGAKPPSGPDKSDVFGKCGDALSRERFVKEDASYMADNDDKQDSGTGKKTLSL